MGLFGGDNDNDNPSQDRANSLLESQINQNKVELEQKRQSLAEQRINIVKSQGAPNWVANRGMAYGGGNPNAAGGGGNLPQGSVDLGIWGNLK
jgi:hypothetical protein